MSPIMPHDLHTKLYILTWQWHLYKLFRILLMDAQSVFQVLVSEVDVNIDANMSFVQNVTNPFVEEMPNVRSVEDL